MHFLHLRLCPWLAALALSLCAGLASGPAAAVPITYQIGGTASGTLGGFAFSERAFSFTGRGDTGDLFSVEPDVWIGPLQDLRIVLDGVEFVPDNAMFFFVNEPAGTAGFIDSLHGNVFDVGSEAFRSWAAVSSLGPLAVDSSAFAPLDTSRGPLQFSSVGSLVFGAAAEAVPIPEPRGLFVLGIVLLALARRLRASSGTAA